MCKALNEASKQDSTWNSVRSPRGESSKNHSQTATKTTVSLYLNERTVSGARNHRLNLSKIAEQALSSILDYLAQKGESESSEVPKPRSFQKNVADPRGFEPPFSGSEGRRLDPDWATGPHGDRVV